MTDSEKYKTVASFTSKVEAEIVAAMLRDNGIPAAAFGFDSSYPSLSFARAIEVKVNEEDYDEALRLINTPPEE
ncbi:MAG: DUF2007 domain-containing protein [Bacteroidales bacterium]|jgi:uncharacterized protein involved in type VI secretion and phage assembly|nr:DUF2007 domain-containing protein [Bacteroidales bacterium]